jgi:hypothetical protein
MKRSTPPGSSRIRPVSKKRFNQLKAFLRSCYQTVDQLLTKIAGLEQIISSKSLTIPPEKKGEEPTTITLKRAQVKGYKLDLRETKLSLKKAEKALRKAELEFQNACDHNAACVKHKQSKFNSRLADEYKAKREKDDRKQAVLNFVNTLKTNDDPKLSSLLSVVNDSRAFRKEMDTILKEADEVTYSTISGLSSVKSEIYRDARQDLRDYMNGNDDNNDEEASAVVPAG